VRLVKGAPCAWVCLLLGAALSGSARRRTRAAQSSSLHLRRFAGTRRAASPAPQSAVHTGVVGASQTLGSPHACVDALAVVWLLSLADINRATTRSSAMAQPVMMPVATVPPTTWSTSGMCDEPGGFGRCACPLTRVCWWPVFARVRAHIRLRGQASMCLTAFRVRSPSSSTKWLLLIPVHETFTAAAGTHVSPTTAGTCLAI
jgi:hypothetical protein